MKKLIFCSFILMFQAAAWAGSEMEVIKTYGTPLLAISSEKIGKLMNVTDFDPNDINVSVRNAAAEAGHKICQIAGYKRAYTGKLIGSTDNTVPYLDETGSVKIAEMKVLSVTWTGLEQAYERASFQFYFGDGPEPSGHSVFNLVLDPVIFGAMGGYSGASTAVEAVNKLNLVPGVCQVAQAGAGLTAGTLGGVLGGLLGIKMAFDCRVKPFVQDLSAVAYHKFSGKSTLVPHLFFSELVCGMEN